jgi:hypothetical protein
MNYAVMVLSIGLAGVIAVSNMQGSTVAAHESLLATLSPSDEITHSVPAATGEDKSALRFIDLRNGTTCKVAAPAHANGDWGRIPMGPGCLASADLAKASWWRKGVNGTLVMADEQGRTVLEFSPGDGVLYESVYPASALITVVPAKS